MTELGWRGGPCVHRQRRIEVNAERRMDGVTDMKRDFPFDHNAATSQLSFGMRDSLVSHV